MKFRFKNFFSLSFHCLFSRISIVVALQNLAMQQPVVHYRFRNESTAFTPVTFDGSTILVEDLKRAIVHQRKLTSRGLDLVVSDASSGQGIFSTLVSTL
jgi:hypothetical protein